jgi:hypothetical protein
MTFAAALLATLACNTFQATTTAGRSTLLPSPTPTPLAVLATTYTQMVAPANSALDALIAALNAPGANMTTTRAAFDGYRVALTSLNAQLPQFEADVPGRTSSSSGRGWRSSSATFRGS